MFGDLMGNMEEQQAKMQEKLKSIQIKHEQDGIGIQLNAAKEILNVEIATELMQEDRKEELQDLLIVHLNRALALADESQQKESSSLINDLLPGGLGGMFGG